MTGARFTASLKKKKNALRLAAGRGDGRKDVAK
jgi:hypothetical protein